MKEIAKELLLWLERVLPGLMASFGLGYKMGEGSREKLEGKLTDEKLEHDKTKNRLKAQSNPISDADAVESVIKSGSEMLEHKRAKRDS